MNLQQPRLVVINFVIFRRSFFRFCDPSTIFWLLLHYREQPWTWVVVVAGYHSPAGLLACQHSPPETVHPPTSPQLHPHHQHPHLLPEHQPLDLDHLPHHCLCSLWNGSGESSLYFCTYLGFFTPYLLSVGLSAQQRR